MAKFNSFPSCVEILCGGDPDGAKAGGCMKAALEVAGITVSAVRYVRSVPLQKFEGDITSPTVLVDVPVDGRNAIEANISWLTARADNILLVVDHHQGDEQFVAALGESKVITGKAPSCPSLMAASGFDVPEWVVAAADFCDDPTGGHPRTDEACIARDAFDVAIVRIGNGDQKALAPILAALTAWAASGDAANPGDVLTAAASAIGPINEATAAAAKTARIIGHSDVAKCDVVLAEQPYGSEVATSKLFSAMYKVAPIALIQGSRDGKDITIVAHNIKGDAAPNLVALFGLTSGNPTRVPLEGEHEATIQRIRAALGMGADIIK